MQTLIKWPGGKTKEFEYIKEIIPKFDRYVEPFFGGGAVFFQLQPKKAIINDICEELVDLYKFVKGEEDRDLFKKELLDYVDNWEKIPKYIKVFEKKLFNLYAKYRNDEVTIQELQKTINDILRKEEDKFNGLFHKSFCLDEQNLLKQIIANLISKIKRTKDIEKQRGDLPEGDLEKNIETGFRSGFYMHFRDVMNFNGTKFKTTKAKKIANYYFIREFCYASMFRFNSSGHFNIPYGGIGYNNKDFRKKVEHVLNPTIQELFRNTKIENKDFELIFKENDLTKKDFIFLDPPYDTDFSDYEKASFDKKDQERLANCLYKTKANFILIIKKTPFIYNLYKNKDGIKIDKFDKTYLYNVKGRNDRDVEHLVIYNF
ncbi:MAG: DNA adenine methylase [bacterium]